MTTQPEALQLAELFETYSADHHPDGWPAIRQEVLNSAAAELRRLHAENEALRVAAEKPGDRPVAKVVWPSASGLPCIEWLVKSSEVKAGMILYAAPPVQPLNIQPPNESGETMCVVRWMAETPNGWIGSYDKAALEQFAAPQPAQQPVDWTQVGKLIEVVLDQRVRQHTTGTTNWAAAVCRLMAAAPQPAHHTETRATAIKDCIDRLEQGGKPAEAGMLRHHFANELGDA